MDLGVALALVATREPATTRVAGERLFTGVRAQVSGQVVGPAERPATDRALERLLAAVDAHVSRQFVAAEESPLAVRHRADMRPLRDRPTAHRHGRTVVPAARPRGNRSRRRRDRSGGDGAAVRG